MAPPPPMRHSLRQCRFSRRAMRPSPALQIDAKCVTFTLLLQYSNLMPKTKIATLNLRIDPGVKEAVREAADQEHRSVANMIEMLIRRHCDHHGIVITEQREMFPGKQNG